MATIGKLVVSLTTRTGKFRKGMAKSSARIKKFAVGIAGIAARAAKFGAVMAGVAAAGVAYFTKQAFATIDATAKLSRQMGISIDGLRGLSRAAQITGADQGALTKGLGFLGKALGEAKSGIGEGKQALESLGLSAEDLIDLPLEKTVGIIADSMNNLTNQSEKAFVASKLFGRGGLALVNTLALGSKGLEEMAAGTKLLQGTLTAIDAGKVEAANDAIVDMRTAATGLFERVAIAVGPFVKRIADNVTRLFIFIREHAAAIMPKVIDWFKGMAVTVADVVGSIWADIKQIPKFIQFAAVEGYRIFKTGMLRLKKEWTTFKAIFETGWSGIGTLIADMWDNVKISFLSAIKWIGDKLSAFAKWIVDVLPGKNEWASELIEGYDQGLAEVDNISDDIEQRSRERWAKFWKANETGANQLTKDMDNLNTELAVLNKALDVTGADIFAGKESGKGWASAIGTAISKIQAIKLPGVVEEFKKGGKLAGGDIATAIKQATSPAAIEKGTVAAYSATVRVANKSIADNGRKTVAALNESNKLQRQANKLLADQTAPAIVGIA